LKDGYDRIIGDGNKLAGVIKRILGIYARKPRDAFNKWKDWLNNIKNKGLLD